MRRHEPEADWREKVNPIFTIGIQVVQIIPRLLRQLAQGYLGDEARIRTVIVESCESIVSYLPGGFAEAQGAAHSWAEQLAAQLENKLLADPEVCGAVQKIVATVQNAPETLVAKGRAGPHWWMAQGSWEEFDKREAQAESLLNVLALLQMKVPLHELTRRVADGDFKLYEKLFRPNTRSTRDPDSGQKEIWESVLRPLQDEAAKIVGRALLLKGDPPGYQLQLRMVLFLGWDFGLCDLSARELHRFMVEMGVVRSSYDPETLRRYRNRLRRLIERTSCRRLPESTEKRT